MLTIAQIVDALESGKMTVGTEVATGATIKGVLGNTIRDWETGKGAHILIYCPEADGTSQWGDTAETYADDFGGQCCWFHNPQDYVWTSIQDADNLTPLGFALTTSGGCVEEWDEVAHWDAQQAKMGLPR
jgi:hypothetical protein